MLTNLHVKNLALIRETEVNFTPGLNILTGETGAGKSVIIGSIGLALGAKVPKGLIRRDADYALVELIFTVKEELAEELAALEVFPEEGEIILSRRMLSSGRSTCRINGETVPAARMRAVASLLIDIHGQHEQESLLSGKNHRIYLDAFAGSTLEEEANVLAACYREYLSAKQALEEENSDSAAREREISFLRYEIGEISAAELVPGEEELLEAEFRRLENARTILETAARCRQLCDEDADSAADRIGSACAALSRAAVYDTQLEELSRQLEEIDCLLGDFNRELAIYAEDFEFSEELFAETGQRLDRIHDLEAKYGNSIPMILEEKEKKEKRLETLLHYEEYLASLQETLSVAEARLIRHSNAVTDIRREKAQELAAEMRQAMLDLNFTEVQFEIEVQPLGHYTAQGQDAVRFLISTNAGEPVKPLDEVASGGELSRTMLALKTVLAQKDDIDTLIFDEIDSGISGRTAQKVAEKIRCTAKNHQVICITHLPQIAAMADSHFLIEKTADETSAITGIHRLNREESIAELARMLGGVRLTEAVLANAREMKELAEAL